MIYLVFVLLAVAQAVVMRQLGNVWRIAGRRVVAWPFYAAWGIGWVITALWYTGDITAEQWLKIYGLFVVCFPPIVWGAQGGDRLSPEQKLQELAKAIDKIADSLSKLVWLKY